LGSKKVKSRVRKPGKNRNKRTGLLLIAAVIVWIPVLSWIFLTTSLCDVQRISVYGIRYGYPEDVLMESGIEEGINIFSDMTAFEKSLRDHPLVQEAKIERRPPRALFIKVREREPFAYLKQAKPVLVSRDGTVLPEDRIAVELDLPLITVIQDEDEYLDMMMEGLRFLSGFRDDAPALYTHISELVVHRGRPEVLYLRTPPTRVLLGPEFTRVSQNLLAGVLASLESDEGFFEVDLRFRDQAVVRSLGEKTSPSLYKTI